MGLSMARPASRELLSTMLVSEMGLRSDSIVLMGWGGGHLGNWVGSCSLPDTREMTLTETGVVDTTSMGC